MNEIKRCKRCIMPESLPSVKLNEEGICNHCLKYESQFGNWDDTKLSRKKEFEHMIKKVKGLKRYYDCLIPLSGGKDSVYTLYLCSKVYKLKCLCVTFDNGFLSEHARQNIKRAVELSGADYIMHGLNRGLMLKLYGMTLKKTGTICPPCLRGIELTIRKAAKSYNIPLVIHGISERRSYEKYPEIVSGGEIIPKTLKADPVEKAAIQLTSIERQKYIESLGRLFFKNWYIVPHHIGIYHYIDVTRDEIYKTIKKEMGWMAPSGEAEHMDCMIHDIVAYTKTLKFPELTLKTTLRSGLIRFGEMTREEALEIENKELLKDQKPGELDEFLREIGMDEDEFRNCARDWKKASKYRSKYKRKLKYFYHKLIGTGKSYN